MKKLILTSVLAVLVVFGTTVMAQEYPDEYLGLPGDNLNLYAVMKLFQESETLEGFERSLNEENSRINNLDLNGDNFVDYIMVSDYIDGDVHTIVLRVALGQNEYQDVAVFTVQRFRDGSVQIQLIGDEALYGQNYIIEPNYGETPNPGYMGRKSARTEVTVVYYTPFEIAEWPMIRFMYFPDYVMWHSSWYWGYYPPYWHSWHTCYWHYYYGYHYNWYHHYYTHYRHWNHHRYERYNDFYYTGIRSHSPQVHQKINEGSYKSTYSHPEQRRDGETLFTAMHPDQEKRTRENTPVISQGRRSIDQSTREQTTTRISSGTARRSDNAANSRSGADPSTRKSTGTSRKSTTTVNERPVIKPSSDKNAAPSRRPAVTDSDRAVSRPKPAEEAVEYRREPDPVPDKVISRPEPAQRKEASKASKPSESQSKRRKTVETKTETVVRKIEKPKKPEEIDKTTR